jgi:hypothetical protein
VKTKKSTSNEMRFWVVALARHTRGLQVRREGPGPFLLERALLLFGPSGWR